MALRQRAAAAATAPASSNRSSENDTKRMNIQHWPAMRGGGLLEARRRQGTIATSEKVHQSPARCRHPQQEQRLVLSRPAVTAVATSLLLAALALASASSWPGMVEAANGAGGGGIISGNSNSQQRLQVIYAINAGGESHVDVHGIAYRRDPLLGRMSRSGSGDSAGDGGTASAFGRMLLIARSPVQDQILYQTERYHTSTFGYDIPVSQDGPYVLILKFCEVYFDAPGQKIFDVVLNGEHVIVKNLDIYARVGRGAALDIVVPFQIKSNKLFVNGQQSIHTGSIRVDFVKGEADNPKVNAVIVLKGTPDMIPELLGPAAPLDHDLEDPQSFGVGRSFIGGGGDDDDDDDEEDNNEADEDDDHDGRGLHHGAGYLEHDEEDAHSDHHYTTATPALPYGFHEGASLLPVFAAIGAFVPIVFCLCRI